MINHPAAVVADEPMRYTLLGHDRVSYQSATAGRYGGHSGTRIYGRLDCATALTAIARGGYLRHRVFFADEETTTAAGYRPCARCLPDAYRVWTSAER